MSEVKNEQATQANDEALSDESLESVAGGIIEGGCTEPFPTKPILDGNSTF